MISHTDDDILALADRLEAPRYRLSGSPEGHEGENAVPHEAAAALRAIVAERQKPQAVRIKPLVWKKGEAKTPFGSYYVVCEDWDDEPFWFVIWNGRPAPYLGEHPSEDAAMAAAEADHAARILSQIEAVPAAQIRAEALEEAAQAASNRAAYFRDAAETASEAGFHALRAFHAMRELCLVEIAAAIRAMKGKPE